MARLILMFKDKILDYFPLATDRGFTIGRHGSNHIIIDNLAVSGYHARIDKQSEGYAITDMQSKNGTFINNRPVTDHLLAHKDHITIGKHTLLVDLLDEFDVDAIAGNGVAHPQSHADANDGQTMMLDTSQGRQLRGEEAPPPPPPEPAYAASDNLTILAGGDGALALSQRQITIGTNCDADIVVGGLWSLLVGSPAAIIIRQAGDYFLSYAGGMIKPKRNGTRVKGTIKLHHEDFLEIGPVRLQVQLSKKTGCP